MNRTMNHHFHIPKEIEFLLQKIESSDRKAYIVGGALRDFIMGRKNCNDFDVATDASPQEIISLFPHVIPTGIKHGTVTVLLGNFQVEVTTFRIEKGYSDGRHPDSVSFVSDIEDDLSRRDFTMNAMAYNHAAGQIIDPFNGQDDIRNRCIRCVGDPAQRFGEDGLRPMRAVRFAAQLGFQMEPATLAAIPACLASFAAVSRERVRDEFEKLLMGEWALEGLRLLESTGLLEAIIPEMMPCRNCSQKGTHVFDVMDHSFHAVAAAPFQVNLRWAALLHDIGKPASMATGPDGIPTFYNHEKISAQLAGQILRRLKLSNDDIRDIVHLIEEHMFHYTEEWSDAAVRRFIARVGTENIDDLFDLRMADSAAIQDLMPDQRNLEQLRLRIDRLIANDGAFGLKDLAVNGNDLLSIGVPKGPLMGKVLDALLETVLDDPEQNNRQTLMNIAHNFMLRLGIETSSGS
ncbi:MAG: HD domain-containing protein [Spirochaetaceae bacterium]|nr:HD domain-containing protein [Spirochaetaceae bacterium]